MDYENFETKQCRCFLSAVPDLFIFIKKETDRPEIRWPQPVSRQEVNALTIARDHVTKLSPFSSEVGFENIGTVIISLPCSQDLQAQKTT
jgi:hypothetical protein